MKIVSSLHFIVLADYAILSGPSIFLGFSLSSVTCMQPENMRRLILLTILISLFFFFFFFFFIQLNITTAAAGDTIAPNQPMKDGETLISVGGAFELGFFSPNGSSQSYLGIWYSNIPGQIVVWVANREAPIARTTGVLELTVDGNLAISDHTNNVIWSTNTSSKTSGSNPIAQLMDDGNLQVLNDSKGLLWQSFDYPSDTMLPGMKLGRDFRTNQEWRFTSWKSASDPSPGNYTYMLKTHGPPETYLLMNGSDLISRSGTWDGQGWDGLPAMIRGNNYISLHLVSNHDEVSYSFEVMSKSIVSRLVVSYDGKLDRFVWSDHHWFIHWQSPEDPCDAYAPCGRYSVCQNDGSTSCSCLRGFVPRSPEQWALRDWPGGCSRRVPLSLDCSMGDGFVKVTQLKLPDTSNTSSDSSKINLDECKDWCLQNCSCLAFAVINPEGGGCIIWFGDLTGIREITDGGDDLYVRLAASELDEGFQYHKKKLGRNRIISIALSLGGLILIGVSISICMVWNKHRKEVEQRRRKQPQTTLATAILAGANELADDILKDSELLMFTFSTLASSTNNFSNENKLGEGGFGQVYKGILPNGQEIAVKRLSRGSIQGVQEFKNEIMLIANLQHKNLVRLLGCCIEGEERILVYEYMPNRSLDCFIFDPIRAVFLDWKRRSRVIHGVAQGLLYLHNYSRLRIIHRDLKTSNILLDSDLNPKISDFGTARIFGVNQDQANTNRVIGTYGYMAPEYAIEGNFSEKSDVFSFGVLLLEIVSGKKNGGHQIGDSQFLIGHAWQLWKDDQILELMDPILRDSCPLQEVIRYVHVGLLCVQEYAADRPTMSSVISFLSTDSAALPSPVKVAFSNPRTVNVHFHSRREDYSSSNDLTVTAIGPR